MICAAIAMLCFYQASAASAYQNYSGLSMFPGIGFGLGCVFAILAIFEGIAEFAALW